MCLHENNGVGSDTLISSHAVWQFALMRKKSCQQTVFRACRWEGDVDCRQMSEIHILFRRASQLPAKLVRERRRLHNKCKIHFLQYVFKSHMWLSLISPMNPIKMGEKRFSQRVEKLFQMKFHLVWYLSLTSVSQLMITFWNQTPSPVFVCSS